MRGGGGTCEETSLVDVLLEREVGDDDDDGVVPLKELVVDVPATETPEMLDALAVVTVDEEVNVFVDEDEGETVGSGELETIKGSGPSLEVYTR